MTNDHRALFVSDVHFPRHDPRKVELFFKVAKAWQPHSIDLVGDIDDADSTSRWAEGTTRSIELVDAGVKGTREFMAELTSVCTRAEDNHLHDGNHGWYRHKKFLDKNAPQFTSFITAEILYQPANYGFQFHDYDDHPVRRFGDLYVHHGEAITSGGGKSVDKDCNKWDVSVLRGHSHRMGAVYNSYELSGRYIEGYEIGHLCDEKQMTYEPTKNWQAGFAIADVVGNVPFVKLIQIKETSHGLSCFVDGVRYDA